MTDTKNNVPVLPAGEKDHQPPLETICLICGCKFIGGSCPRGCNNSEE